MNTLSPEIEALIAALDEGGVEELSLGKPMEKMHNLTKKVGVLYEKIRYMVDYQEEHTIRRNAIERILRRKIMIESVSYEDMGKSLMQELVTGGYITEQHVTIEITKSVQGILDEFSQSGLGSAYISFTASEVNAFLFPAKVDDLVIDAMYLTMRKNLQFIPAINEAEGDIQTYLACRRSLLKEDQKSLRYALWIRSGKSASISDLEELEKNKVGWQIVPRLKNQTIYFSVIRAIVLQYGVQSKQIFEDSERLSHFATSFLENKYKENYKKTKTSSFRAVVYIFCTKILLALGLELPYDLWIAGGIHYLALGVNVLFHPTLLFLMTWSISPLDSKNTSSAISGIKSIISDNFKENIVVRTKTSRPLLSAVFSLAYACMCLVSFGSIYFLLDMLHFNVASIVLFLFFLTLVSYFGLRIRHSANSWKLESEKQGLLNILGNLFILPIVRAGRWLSIRFSAVNVFVFILDFIIETPFKLLLKVSDAFFAFLREKKEEISI